MPVRAKIILDRIEVVKRKFDKKGRCYNEQIEFYSPVEEEIEMAIIGFDLKHKKNGAPKKT